MISLLSPAKSLDFSSNGNHLHTDIRFPKDSLQLVKTLRNKPVKYIKELMSVSNDIAKLNSERFKAYDEDLSNNKGKQAVLAFNGDVYLGLEAKSFNESELAFAQDHLRILSGLYGLLKPMDMIQPYRLEMGTRLKTRRGTNLYQFWGDKITKVLNQDLEEGSHDTIINLASNEYFKVLNKKKLKADVVDVNFREFRDGEFKFISFTAKKARGMMARYLIKNEINDRNEILGFDYDGYAYNEELSSENNLFFTK